MILRDSMTNLMVGLGVHTYTCTAAGPLMVSVQATENPISSLTITIAQTGSTSVSVATLAPAAAQSHIELQKIFNVAISDTITITLASAAAIDNQLNTLKTLITIRQGLV